MFPLHQYLRDVDGEGQVLKLGLFVVGVGDEDLHGLSHLRTKRAFSCFHHTTKYNPVSREYVTLSRNSI